MRAAEQERCSPLGFAAAQDSERSYGETDLARALEAYRFFYPTVSGDAIFRGSAAVGLRENRVFGVLDTRPRHRIFTANSDTPYGLLLLDLGEGPLVVEVPPGPLLAMAMDVHQRWVADMGLAGADAGRGGRYLLLGPGQPAPPPKGCSAAQASAQRVLLAVRALPLGGDLRSALALVRSVRVQPLHASASWREPEWIDLSEQPQDTTPLACEGCFAFWERLHEVLEREPVFTGYRAQYGLLAALGIAKGESFAPDARLRGVLERAAQLGHAQLCARAFADRRPDRVVWRDRRWEWAALRFENGSFDAANYLDLEAREKWFFQAIGASPAMMRRQPGAGSLYWLACRDARGEYLDGGRSYRLRVPRPLPAELFWSVTVYDAQTRSQIETEQGRAALRSLFELRPKVEPVPASAGPLELRFGPRLQGDDGEHWIQTLPGRGWFAYLRLYGPRQAAFDGSWRPGDFEEVRS